MQDIIPVLSGLLAAWCAVLTGIVIFAGSDVPGEESAPWLGLDRWVWIYGGAALALTIFAWEAASWQSAAGAVSGWALG
jgi:hypothetical protein